MGGILRWGVRVSKIKIAGEKNSQERGSQALTKTGGGQKIITMAWTVVDAAAATKAMLRSLPQMSPGP